GSGSIIVGAGLEAGEAGDVLEIAGGGATFGPTAAISAGNGNFCRSNTKYQPAAAAMPRAAAIEAPINRRARFSGAGRARLATLWPADALAASADGPKIPSIA